MIKKIKEFFFTLFNKLNNKEFRSSLWWYIIDYINGILVYVSYIFFIWGTRQNYFYLQSVYGMSGLTLCTLDLLAGLFLVLVLKEGVQSERFFKNRIKSKIYI